MIKSVEIGRNTAISIVKDGIKIAEIYAPMVGGYIDTDKFKHVETVEDPIKLCINVRIEV